MTGPADPDATRFHSYIADSKRRANIHAGVDATASHTSVEAQCYRIAAKFVSLSAVMRTFDARCQRSEFLIITSSLRATRDAAHLIENVADDPEPSR